MIVWAIAVSHGAIGQGKLLLIGGGGEEESGWSDAPYQWAVDQSANKKVAIISFNNESDWLPNYFKGLGASHVRNFKIDTEALANNLITYDTLIRYDVVFLKGGNQHNYYTAYRNSLLTQALEAIYSRGGVLAGTSAGMMVLSEVIFTAAEGSLYPDECIRSLENKRYTLANDFLSIAPKFLFDSHFVERGRLLRLLGMMAKWKVETGEDLRGIGVDDRTALGIIGDKAYTFGSASVTILATPKGYELEADGTWSAKGVQYRSLVDGQMLDLSTGEVSDYQAQSAMEGQVRGQQSLLFGGGRNLANATALLEKLAALGSSEAPIAIVTGSRTTTANNMKTVLENLGATATVVQAITSNGQDEAVKQAIASSKFLVVDNNWAQLNSFITSTDNGRLLHQYWQASQPIIAFVGDNAGFAGEWFCSNISEDKLSSYYGELSFEKGLGLIASTAIVGNTFSNSTSDRDFYENKTSALSYLMTTKGLEKGIWVSQEGVVYAYANNGDYWVSSEGIYPSVMLSQQGSAYSLANSERQVVGFDSFELSMITSKEPVRLGIQGVTGTELFSSPKIGLSTQIKQGEVHIGTQIPYSFLEVYNSIGKSIYRSDQPRQSTVLSTSSWQRGIYIVRVITRSGGFQIKKILINQ